MIVIKYCFIKYPKYLAKLIENAELKLIYNKIEWFSLNVLIIKLQIIQYEKDVKYY